MEGVVRTRVGYAGGTKDHPTYHDLGDHTESIQLDYDPAKLSYEKLLDAFWSAHDPTERPWSTQYKAILFWHDEEQRAVAEKSRDAIEKKLGRRVTTELVKAGTFTPAEDYHQKYVLQNSRAVAAQVAKWYRGDFQGFVDSTAAARLNGYLAGYGDGAQLERELPSLGLEPALGAELLAKVKARAPRKTGGCASPGE